MKNKTKFALFAVLMAAIMALVFTVPADAAYKTPFFSKRFPGGGVVIADQSQTTGNYWFVDSGHTNASDAAGYCQNPDSPCATVDYAIGLATAAQGDTIIVMAGHAETIAAADGFDADKAGLRIIGLGDGANRPTFTFTATGSTIAVGAANVVFENLRFVAGVHAIAIGIAIEAAGDNFTMRNCEFPEPGTNTFDFIDAIDFEALADGAKIIGNYYYHTGATGPAHFVEAGNGINIDYVIEGNHLYSEFSVAAIWSNDIDLRVTIKDNVIMQMTSGEFAIEYTAAATGFITGNRIFTDAQATSIDPGSMYLTDNKVTTAINVSGIDYPVHDTGWAEINATDLAAIQAEATAAIVADDLDHLLMLDGATQVYPENAATDSILAKILVKADPAVPSQFNNSTDSLEAIRDIIDTNNTADQVDLDAILADTDMISGVTLPVAPTANSLAAFIASGGTGLGTELADSKSIVDAIGTDGTTVADTATGIAGMIGVNDANNVMDTSTVVTNDDGSVFERLEGLLDQAEKAVTGSTAVMVNGDTLFTIAGGPIKVVDLVSICITLNDGTASTLQYSADPTVGAAITFSGASATLANFAAGGGAVLNQTALATAPDLSVVMVGLGSVSTNKIIINEGIITAVIGTGSTTGTWKHYLRYVPLGPGVTVTGT